jgi:CDP-paratose 2-epimerase
MKETILVVGGAGFVGANLSLMLKNDFPGMKIIAFDNLRRRGSEFNIPRLKSAGIAFFHGDIRNREDLNQIDRVDILIDCAAEPSVLAGYGGSPTYVIDTNFNGSINCFELARKRKADVIFLSTSRVYPLEPIRTLKYTETETRLELAGDQKVHGVTKLGISEQFPLNGNRTIYGVTKLAAELVLSEYLEAYDMSGIINRCGVLTGPWQMGTVDQGFVVFWVARHFYGGQLSYIGNGGKGKQVRDILHIKDLYSLLKIQLDNISQLSGHIFNVGGGLKNSVSLIELTSLCRQITGKRIELSSDQLTRPGDIPWYISDYTQVNSMTGWHPRFDLSTIIEDITDWIKRHNEELKILFT